VTDTTIIPNSSSDASTPVLNAALGNVSTRFEPPGFLQKSTIRAPWPHPAPDIAGAENGKNCHRRVLCVCAQKELREGEAIEQKIWAVLSLCGAATILYAAYCFFLQG